MLHLDPSAPDTLAYFLILDAKSFLTQNFILRGFFTLGAAFLPQTLQSPLPYLSLGGFFMTTHLTFPLIITKHVFTAHIAT